MDIERLDEYQKTLEDELEADTPQTGKIEALEQEIEQIEKDIKIDENQYEDSVTEKDRLNGEQRERKSQLDAVAASIDSVNKKLAKANLSKNLLEKDQHDTVLKKNEAFAKVDDAKAKRERRETVKEQQEVTVEAYKRQATQVCARVAVDPGVSADAYDKKLLVLQEQIEKAQNE